MNKHVRTRFAPSPTGFMHVGGVRTALFAWLIARAVDGAFILRIEDTDRKREVEGSADHIVKSLLALGIEYDEGPNIGGEHGPYFQSERLDIYRSWAQKLIDQGRAYADPYTAEELNQFRDEAKAAKKPFLYRNHRPESLPEWDGTTPLRFRSAPKRYTWHDEVMGELSAGEEVVDDFILIKSDGYPTYNFAHIVDDVEMGITHVIRGQEFIASQPNYLNLYEALGIERPVFATMPHIMAETGGKKLGKRDGAKDVLDYMKDGYVKEAIINFIATLGWNDGTEKEVFTVEELISTFDLSRVQKSGARFDAKRLLWLNGQHIRTLDIDDLYERADAFWGEEAAGVSPERKKEILALVQDRLKTLTDIPLLTSYFFTDPIPNWAMTSEQKQLRKTPREELVSILEKASDKLAAASWTAEALQTALNELLEETEQKPAVLFSIIRLSVSWSPFSPALNETLETLGKETALARIEKSIQMA